MRRRRPPVWPVLLLVLLAACQPEADEVIVVDSFADTVDDDPGNGTCADASGECTLRAAIMEANAAADIDQIVVPAGSYLLDRTGADEDAGLTGDLDITGSTYIEASGGIATIDGAGLGDRLIDIHGGTWHLLDGLRLINGDVTGRGGALRTTSGITIARVDISGNQASVAGGGIASDAVLTLDRSSITANTAPEGGGISTSRLLLADNSTLSANTGGALMIGGGDTRLRFSTITDNTDGGVAGQTGSIDLLATVVAHQATGADCTGPVNSRDHNVDSDDTCGLDQPADDPGATVPFGPLQAAGADVFAGHSITGPSSVHNGVPPGTHGCGGPVDRDQFGQVRPLGSACDIGAVETALLTQQVFCSFDGIVHAIAPASGDYYVGGDFSQVSDDGGTSASRPGLARCRADGSVDPGFDPGLATAVHALVVEGDWLYAGGSFDVTTGGTRYRGVARIDLTTGLLDDTWSPDVDGSVRAIAVGPTGVFVGGNVTQIDGAPVSRLAKLDATTGARITAFSVTVVHSIDWENVLSLHRHSSGDLLVGGTFETINGANRASVARVDATDGSVQPFAPQLTDTNPNDPKVQIEAIVEHDGSIYLCGDWWETEGIGSQADQRNVGRFDPTSGAADVGWLPSVNRGLQACAIDTHGLNLIVAGDHTIVNGQPAGAVEGLDLTTGMVDATWLPDPSTTVGVKTVAVGTDWIALGGDITAASGTSVGNATLYRAD